MSEKTFTKNINTEIEKTFVENINAEIEKSFKNKEKLDKKDSKFKNISNELADDDIPKTTINKVLTAYFDKKDIREIQKTVIDSSSKKKLSKRQIKTIIETLNNYGV